MRAPQQLTVKEIHMKHYLHVLLAGAAGALAAYFNVLLIPLCVLVAVIKQYRCLRLLSMKKEKISIALKKKLCYTTNRIIIRKKEYL